MEHGRLVDLVWLPEQWGDAKMMSHNGLQYAVNSIPTTKSKMVLVVMKDHLTVNAQ